MNFFGVGAFEIALVAFVAALALGPANLAAALVHVVGRIRGDRL